MQLRTGHYRFCSARGVWRDRLTPLKCFNSSEAFFVFVIVIARMCNWIDKHFSRFSFPVFAMNSRDALCSWHMPRQRPRRRMTELEKALKRVDSEELELESMKKFREGWRSDVKRH